MYNTPKFSDFSTFSWKCSPAFIYTTSRTSCNAHGMLHAATSMAKYSHLLSQVNVVRRDTALNKVVEPTIDITKNRSPSGLLGHLHSSESCKFLVYFIALWLPASNDPLLHPSVLKLSPNHFFVLLWKETPSLGWLMHPFINITIQSVIRHIIAKHAWESTNYNNKVLANIWFLSQSLNELWSLP